MTHCFLYSAAKTLPFNLNEVLNVCVKVVNKIRGRALNHRIFQSFCEELGKVHTVQQYHTEVRWLSRGSMLSRVYELRSEIFTFLREKGCEEAKYFCSVLFIHILAYLADIFTLLNELNLLLQGKEVNAVIAHETSSFQR